MNDTVLLGYATVNPRIAEVVEQLKKVSSTVEDGFFDMCDLLQEAHDHEYHLHLGFVRFTDWVEAESSQLDISARQATYCVNIANKAMRLNVDRPTMKRVKVSKLKEIFSLDPDEHSSAMQELLASAETMTLDEVKAKVRLLKMEAGHEEMVFMTLKFPASAKPIIEGAFEQCKSKLGDYDGKEPSNGRALELICQEWTESVDQEDEQQ